MVNGVPQQRITSPGMAPSYFHLFPKLKEHLRGEHFSSDDDAKANVKHWLSQEDRQFCCDVMKRVERWQKCVDCRGDYVDKYAP